MTNFKYSRKTSAFLPGGDAKLIKTSNSPNQTTKKEKS